MGIATLTGKNYDHRKRWIERLLEHQAVQFGIRLSGQAMKTIVLVLSRLRRCS